MHFSLPKPVHGWRAFVGEVGIIVIGVLIALGAENLVERWHWHDQLEQSNGALKGELLYSAQVAYERLAIQRCLQGRLRDLALKLNASDGQWRALPEVFIGASRFYSSVLPVVYRAPLRPIYGDAWRNALADDTINHMDSTRAQNLSKAYAAAEAFKAFEEEEGRVETKLSPLGSDRPIDERTRLEMLQTIAQLDRLNDLLVTEGHDLFESIRSAKIGISRSEADRIRDEVVHAQRSYRGTCVAAPQLDLDATFLRGPPSAQGAGAGTPSAW